MKNNRFDQLFLVKQEAIINMTADTEPGADSIPVRYKYDWYNKRIIQNAKIKEFLIACVNKHKELNFPWSKRELACLNYEDLFEIAVACVNKKISVLAEAGRDWTYGADGKVSIVRKHGRNNSSYGAGITNCKNKKYILAMVYEPHHQLFYFFAFPTKMDEHAIPFDTVTKLPKRDNWMWEYECDSFEVMSHRAHTWMACR